MRTIFLLGLVAVTVLAWPIKPHKPHHHIANDDGDICLGSVVRRLGKAIKNQKIDKVIKEVSWLNEDDLERYQTKLQQLKGKLAGDLKAQSGKKSHKKLIWGFNKEKKHRGTLKIAELEDPDLKPLLFRGDVLLTEEQLDYLLAQTNKTQGRQKRQASTVFSKWSSNKVNYYFDSAASYTTAQKDLIRAGFKLWNDNTCLTFTEVTSATTPANKIKITKSDGCWATLGMQSNGQIMSLPTDCIQLGVIAHEMGHAIGLWHHQERSDRENYIEIHPENILPDEESQSQYSKSSPTETNNYNTPYDYGSIMHYGDDFMGNGNGPTMEALDPLYQETMGQSEGLSFYDVLLINRHYNCLGNCPSLACQNSGFPNPKDCSKCICPSGFSGTYCQNRPAGTNSAICSGATLQATSTWQTLTASLNKPWSEEHYDKCTWWIEAPAGSTVEVQMVEMERYASCGMYTLDIKARDLANSGYRMCVDMGDGKVSMSNVPLIKSETNKVIILASNSYGTFNFKLNYRIGGAPTGPVVTQSPPVTQAPTCKNIYSDSDCQYWKDIGDCVNDEAWMRDNCAKTCSFCGSGAVPAPTTPATTCKNVYSDSDCQYWANIGDCVNDAAWMKDNCAKTCNACGSGSGSTCKNVHSDSDCQYWKDIGDCVNDEAWMRDNCKKTCQFC